MSSVTGVMDWYKYYKNGDSLQKPEKCPFWSLDASENVCKELTRLLDYTDPKVLSTRLASICNTTCTIVAGSDQGQGAWRSWMKIGTMSGAEVRERMVADKNVDPKNSYIISNAAHITCKKDNHKILLIPFLKAFLLGMKGFNHLL
jgi:hypothetical protein